VRCIFTLDASHLGVLLRRTNQDHGADIQDTTRWVSAVRWVTTAAYRSSGSWVRKEHASGPGVASDAHKGDRAMIRVREVDCSFPIPLPRFSRGTGPRVTRAARHQEGT
jgi:hypothetical protein